MFSCYFKLLSVNYQDPPKEELAKIRAEVLVRYDDTIEAYEIIQLTCELLGERAKLIDSVKECPQDLHDSISTLIWASNVVDISELVEVRKLFKSKYGAKFIEKAATNSDGSVNERVVQKLSIMPPTAYIVQTYLERIAEQFEIHWEPSVRLQPEDLCRPMAAPTGYSVMTAPGSGLVSSSFVSSTIQQQPTPVQGPAKEEAKQPISMNDLPQAIPLQVSAPSSHRTFYAPSYTPLPEPDIIVLPDDVMMSPSDHASGTTTSTTSSSLQQDASSNHDMSDLQRRLAQLKR